MSDCLSCNWLSVSVPCSIVFSNGRVVFPAKVIKAFNLSSFNYVQICTSSDKCFIGFRFLENLLSDSFPLKSVVASKNYKTKVLFASSTLFYFLSREILFSKSSLHVPCSFDSDNKVLYIEVPSV